MSRALTAAAGTLDERAAHAPASSSLRGTRGNSDLVLIVDDVPDNLAVLHDALDESGYTVLVATSGERRCSAPRRRGPTSCCSTR